MTPKERSVAEKRISEHGFDHSGPCDVISSERIWICGKCGQRKMKLENRHCVHGRTKSLSIVDAGYIVSQSAER